jgi:hypothetical protein
MRLAFTTLLLLVVSLGACDEHAAEHDLAATVVDLAETSRPDAGVRCAQTSCDIDNGNVCCVESGFEFCGSVSACSAGLPLYCGGASDCSGDVCCQTATSVSCSTTCADAIVCASDDECPSNMPHCCAPLVSGSARRTCATTCS